MNEQRSTNNDQRTTTNDYRINKSQIKFKAEVKAKPNNQMTNELMPQTIALG